MNDASRFERGERYSVVRDITTYRGVDPLTGLDVLIYDFPGEPTAAAGSVSSEHVLPILAAERSGGRGTVVSALPHGASLVAPGERVVDDNFVLQAMTALRDAHALGLVHGDLSTSRILYAGSLVQLEGYGVPWAGDDAPTGEEALHADLQALVRALLELGSDALSTEVAAALKGASAKGAYPPMNAPRLQAIIRRLAGGAVKVPAAGFNDLTLPTSQVPPRGPQANAGGARMAAGAAQAGSTPAGTSSSGQAPTGPTRPGPAQTRPTPAGPGKPGSESRAQQVDHHPTRHAPPRGDRAADAQRDFVPDDDPEPITLNSDPGLTPPPDAGGGPGRSPRDTSPGFVKALPPGATYRHGNVDEGLRPAPIRLDSQEETVRRRRSWRGPALLLLVVLVAGLAAYLTILAQQRDAGGPTASAVYYLVEVKVEPPNMPPVQLIVEQSPQGSTNARGTAMASVPGRVPFDAAGTWVVHGKFQERTTEPVTVQVPETTSFTLSFPAESGQ